MPIDGRLQTYGSTTSHWKDYPPLVGRRKLLFEDLTHFDTQNLVLDVQDNSVMVRNFSKLSVYSNSIFSETMADLHKFKYYDKLIAGNNNFYPSQNSHGYQAPKSGQ